MKKDKQVFQVIHSLLELPDALQKDLKETRRAVGITVFLIYLTAMVWLQPFPNFLNIQSILNIRETSLFYMIDSVLLVVSGFFPALLSMLWVHKRILYREGYVLQNMPHACAGNFERPPMAEVPWSNMAPSHHSSSMSINTGSGLPMCGSSGMDVRGNPSGTSSW